jgi:flagellar FliL protein
VALLPNGAGMDILSLSGQPLRLSWIMSFGMGTVLSMRLITSAIAVLSLGGAGGIYMTTHPAQWLGPKVYAARKADEAEALRYVKIRPLFIPIIGDKGVSEDVSISITIEVPDSERAQVVRTDEPFLTDAFIHDMYGVLNNSSGRRDGVVRVDVIKDRLNRTSRRILGDENVNDVLLEVVYQQRAM